MDLSFQLYSARNEPSLDTTLGALRDLGYAQVEGWRSLFDDPVALCESLQRAGLSMPTANMSFAQVEDTDTALRTMEALGIQTVFCSAPPSQEYREGRGDWQRFADDLDRIAGAFRRAGVGFGYHNHNWEFAELADGRRPIELLLASQDVRWEADLAWIAKAGEDPLDWMDRLGSRIEAVHIKDIAPAGENADEGGWADVGTGTLDWASLLAAARTRTDARFFVMEHDNPTDAMRFARRSLEAVSRWTR